MSQTENTCTAVHEQSFFSWISSSLKEKKVVLPSNIKYCSKLDKLLLTTIATTHKHDLSKGKRFWSSSSSVLIHTFKEEGYIQLLCCQRHEDLEGIFFSSHI